jgi:hypothetical protein
LTFSKGWELIYKVEGMLHVEGYEGNRYSKVFTLLTRLKTHRLLQVDIDRREQGWIYWGGGGAGGGLFFMIKQKIIRDKMRFCNLSNNMISEQ